jgi:hypothetical protein
MEKIKRNGWKVAFLAVVGALMCSHVIFGDAANWDPPGPPAPTMTSLDAIQSAVEDASCGVSEREGYCQFLSVEYGTHTLFTVPTGKRFVLLKLFVPRTNAWYLRVDGEALIHYAIAQTSSTAASYMWDFPDRCVVVDPGQVLEFENGIGTPLAAHIIGYFYDVP